MSIANTDQKRAVVITLALSFIAIALLIAFPSPEAYAAAISVDAGLTPAEGRWVFRTMVHRMERGDDPTAMDRRMTSSTIPIVLAFGLRPQLTVILRQAVHSQSMSMGSTDVEHSGASDLLVMTKYKIYRSNSSRGTLGVASLFALELPTGDSEFTSGTWDLRTGLLATWRRRAWTFDFNASMEWNGLADRGPGDMDPGEVLSLDAGLTRQIGLGAGARSALAPVVELSYQHGWPDRRSGYRLPDSGESLLRLSPGAKFTRSSFVLEGLVQVPVWQDQRGNQLALQPSVLLGIRYMF